MRIHNRTLFRTARAILRDDAEAEDALQEAYLQAYRAFGYCLMHENEGPQGEAERGELRRVLEQRIDDLPDGFRAVFVLRALEELTVEETAAALDIPAATVRTRFFRARSQLREAQLAGG